jgi:hypothetical protein
MPAFIVPVMGQEKRPPHPQGCFAQRIDQPADLQDRMAACLRVIGDSSVSADKRAEAYLRHALARAQQIALSNSNDGIDRALAALAGSRPIQSNPELQKSIHETRARLYLRKADLDRAIVEYTAWLGLEPNSAAAYAQRGMAYRTLGKVGEAIADLRKALSLEPSNAAVKEELRLTEVSAPTVGKAEDKGPDANKIGVLKAELKQAQEAAKAMEDRLAALEAAKAAKPAPAPRSDAAKLAGDLQSQLKRVGCYPGAVDAQWGKMSQLALQRFAQHAALALPLGEPTTAALEAVSARPDRVCPLACEGNETEVNGTCVARRTRTKGKRSHASRRGERSPTNSSGRPSGGPSVGITIGVGRRGGIGIGF